MTRPLRLLRVEEGPDEWSRVEPVLRQGGFEVQARGLGTLEALRGALVQEPWQALLFDEGARGLTLAQVLDAVRESGRDVPVLVLSRGEGVGVEALSAGARDFFSRSHLARLPGALERELEAARDRAARERAERDRSLLSRAGELLSRSLDVQETLERVVHVMVPELADWCAIYLPEGPGLKLQALAHQDPSKVTAGFEFDRSHPVDPRGTMGVMRAWRRGEAQLLENVSPDMMEAAATSPAHLRMLRTLQLRSIMNVPLLGRNECLGVMALGISWARPGFVPSDLTLCQDLARRAALALENARLYREAQEAIQLRDDFLAVASHELRTPLTTLGLQMSSLVQRARRESAPALVERLERGLRQVRRLGTLVESLLDVSRLSSEELPLSLEPVDLTELVGEVLERFELEARSMGCALMLEMAPGVVGRWDRMRVEQVVSSLVANALKFGPRQPVRVSGGAEGSVARVVVEDQGIGIPEGHLERIFERFGRAVSSRSYGGLGLGLYLARRMAEAHGGRLWAERRAEGGARFTLELPLERA